MRQQAGSDRHANRLTQWWAHRPERLRQGLGTAALLLLIACVSLALGVSTAKASSPVGPHQAHWRTTLDSTLTVDLGPLGAVSMPSRHKPLGVEVVIGEIPSQTGVKGLENAQLSDILSGDVVSYGNLVAHPDLTVRAGVRALAQDALRRATVVACALLCLAAVVHVAARRSLRAAVRAARARPVALVLLLSTSLVCSLALLVPALRTGPARGERMAVLMGTPYEQARLSGRVADVVSGYGGRVRQRLEDNSEFYKTARANLRAAWEQAEADGARASATQPVTAGATDAGVPTPATSQDASSAPARPGSNLPAPATAPAQAGPGTITAVFSTDLHCNLDVIALTGVLDELAQADVHLDSGDLTMTGTQPENVCADALDRAVPAGVERVFTGGNHDSAATGEHLRSLGWTVTDGTVQEVHGLRVLGDADPTRTTFAGTVQVGQEDAPALGARLAATSCEPGADVDLVLIHQPYTFAPLVKDGCAPLLLAGHVHSEWGLSGTLSPHSRNGVVSQLVSGAGKGGTSLGPVTKDAFLHVLRFDAEGELVAWRTVTLHPDASVDVSAWQAPVSPQQAQPLEDLETPAPSPAPKEASTPASPQATTTEP